VALVVLGGLQFIDGFESNGKDLDFSCFTFAHIEGARIGQGGAVRCYLQALADSSPEEMRAVIPADGLGGDEIVTPAAFTFAAAARAGIASVVVRQNSEDSADAQVRIRFANGEIDVQSLEITDPESRVGWRFWGVNDHTTEDFITG
jgi:hypothetical protein